MAVVATLAVALLLVLPQRHKHDATQQQGPSFEDAQQLASAVLAPTFPKENTRLDANPIGTIFNEGAYAAHFCNIDGAPSISLPTPVKWPASGVPVSVMLWGTDDRKLLAMALAARLLSFGLIVSSRKLQFS